MKKIGLLGLFLLIFAAGIGFSAVSASAQVAYPIPELGNCASAGDCYNYCQIYQNFPACWSYGKYILHKAVLGESTASPEARLRSLGIAFPIGDLGNCASPQACKEYCGIKDNYAACTAFAQKIGLTKKQTPLITPGAGDELLVKAKSLLGCQSREACYQYCQTDQNKSKCAYLSGVIRNSRPQPSPRLSVSPPFLPNIFQLTQTVLSCDSLNSCKEVCSKQENYQKCAAFAREHNLYTSSGKQDHPLPSGYPSGIPHRSEMPGGFSSGSAGIKPPCTNEKECYQYCQEHKDSCPGFKQINVQPVRLTTPPLGIPPHISIQPVMEGTGQSGVNEGNASTPESTEPIHQYPPD